MQHFADYEIDKAIAKYEGLPHIAKDCNCWDGYKRVPGTKPCAPGSCEKCDSHSKKSNELNSQPFANPVPLEDEPGYTAGGDDIDASLEQAPSAVGSGKEAGAHKVEEKNDEFYVVEDGEGEVAGPFDEQEEAYARANELNDLENLETEETHKEEKAEGGISLTITMAKVLAMKESATRRQTSQGDQPSPKAAQAVFDALSAGNKEAAKELLKQTDCPEGCETHPEGKCNHGYMAAGRTRVRYLVSSEPFGKEDKYTGPVE
jgi:hypothetical protein